MWRRPGDGDALQQRLARLQWEANSYIERLKVWKALLIVQAEDRERQSRERASAMTEAIVAGRDRAGAEEAEKLREERRRLTIDPRFK